MPSPAFVSQRVPSRALADVWHHMQAPVLVVSYRLLEEVSQQFVSTRIAKRALLLRDSFE